MREAWQRLQPRQRRVIAGGLVLALLIVAWGALWQPLSRARDALRAQVARGEAELIWMREAAPLAAAAEVAPRLQPDGRSLLARIDASARAGELGSALVRVEPVAEREVRVLFEEARFDALVGWLEALAATGAHAREISARRGDGVGLVDARITVVEAP